MKTQMPTRILLLGTALLAFVGCRVEREPNYEWLPWLNPMMFSSSAETNSKNVAFKNGMTNQLPPVGTIPRGFTPLHFSNDEDGRKAAGEQLQNPFAANPENLARGKVVFQTFCLPCHGDAGMGDGPVSKRGMPGFPIGGAENNAAKWVDGYIFHLISYGRGVMPSYATQIKPEDRWKAILYLRQLQQTAQPAAVAPAAAPTPNTAPTPAAAP